MNPFRALARTFGLSGLISCGVLAAIVILAIWGWTR